MLTMYLLDIYRSIVLCLKVRGGLGRLALARWAGWSAGQVGRHIKC